MPEEIAGPATPPVISTDTIPSVSHSSQASEHTEVNISPAKAISATEKLGLKPKGQIMGPKDALGKSATPTTVIKSELKRLREKFTPKNIVPRADEPAKPTGKLADRQRDEKGRVLPKTEAAPVITETAKPKPTEPVPIARIKIGDKEMTPEEIEAQIKELREKAEAKPKDEPKQADPKEEQAAEQQRQQELGTKRQKFLDERIKKFTELYTPDPKRLDIILSGGPEAAKAWAEEISQTVARAVLDTREEMGREINRALSERDAEIKPLLDQQKEIESYRTESSFLNEHPEIKDHAKGISEARQVRQAMSSYYDQIQQKIAQGTATQEERQHAERYEKATAKEFDDSVAAYTRERLGITDAKPATIQAVTAQPKPEPIKPQPKPPTGQPVGGPASPVAMSSQQAHIARMRSAGV